MDFDEFCRSNDITIVFSNLNGKVRGFCTYIDNCYIVVIDERMDGLQQRKTLIHELIHIFERHLESDYTPLECEQEVKYIIKEIKENYINY